MILNILGAVDIAAGFLLMSAASSTPLPEIAGVLGIILIIKGIISMIPLGGG